MNQGLFHVSMLGNQRPVDLTCSDGVAETSQKNSMTEKFSFKSLKNTSKCPEMLNYYPSRFYANLKQNKNLVWLTGSEHGYMKKIPGYITTIP